MASPSEVEELARLLCDYDATAPHPDARIYIQMKPCAAWEGRLEMATMALAFSRGTLLPAPAPKLRVVDDG